MNAFRPARPAAALVAIMAAATVGLTACSGGSNAVSQAGSPFRYVGANKPGSVIAADKRGSLGNVTGQYLNGSPFSMSQDLGKITVVNFWATWCGPCTAETPQFDLVYRAYKSKGVTFVGIDTKESSKDAPESFIKDNDISYPIVFDEPGKVAIEMGNIPLLGLPDTVIVDKQGRVAAVYVGPVTANDLDPALNKLIAET